jgi:hypothetical protein
MPGTALKWVLPVAAIAEAATGVVPLIDPSLMGQEFSRPGAKRSRQDESEQ